MCFGRVVETCRGALGRYWLSRDLRQYQHGSADTSVRAQMSKQGQSKHLHLVSPRRFHTPSDSPGVLGTWQGTSGGSWALSCAFAAASVSCGDTSVRNFTLRQRIRSDQNHGECGNSSDGATSATQSEGRMAALASIYWLLWFVIEFFCHLYWMDDWFLLMISDIYQYPISRYCPSPNYPILISSDSDICCGGSKNIMAILQSAVALDALKVIMIMKIFGNLSNEKITERYKMLLTFIPIFSGINSSAEIIKRRHIELQFYSFF